jgi:hypothetical protein
VHRWSNADLSVSSPRCCASRSLATSRSACDFVRRVAIVAVLRGRVDAERLHFQAALVAWINGWSSTTLVVGVQQVLGSQPVPDTRKQHCSVATKPEMVVSAQLLELRHRQGGQPGADVRPKGTLKLDSTGRIIVWDVVGATAADAAVGGNAGSWSGRHSTKPATASSRE